MTLQRIQDCVPPPPDPIHTGALSSWEAIQKRLDVTLPTCLAEYGRVYVSGYFEGANTNEVRIYNPFDPAYENFTRRLCHIYAKLKDGSPEYFRFECFPAKNSLFPIANGTSQTSFWIRQSANPERYTVIFDDVTTGLLEFPNLSVFEFFYEFFQNRIEKIPYFSEPISFVKMPLHFFPD